MKKFSWKDRPTIINIIPKDKEIMFVDESGNGSKNMILTSFDKKGEKHEDDLRNDIYILNGVVLSGKEHIILSTKFANIKKKITTDGFFEYAKYGLRPINLHNNEINRGVAPFNNLSKEFYEKLDRAILTTKYHQIVVGINYYAYVKDKEYNEKYNPLLMNLGVLVSKYARYLFENNLKGIIIFESENEKNDSLKLEYIINLIRYGTRKNDKAVYKCITAVYFRNKWTADKDGVFRTCAGLELADLTISPVRRLYHSEFITIETKLLDYPNYGRNAINILK